jgi:FMN phosphatase YigB (HAD superfamily)
LFSYSEINSLKEIISLIENYNLHNQEILIVFDIDNTLLEPAHVHGLGSDQWFCGLIEKYTKEGMDVQAAVAKAVRYYEHVQFNIHMKVIEDELHEIINLLKNNQNYHLICLTARSASLAEKTIDQMYANNLDFYNEQIADHYFDTKEKSIYKKGILFCGNNSKGIVLAKFLEKINKKPQVIIFVDDKEKNLKVVEAFAQEKNIDYYGLRFASCDEKVKNFDHDKASLALDLFLIEQPICPLN